MRTTSQSKDVVIRNLQADLKAKDRRVLELTEALELLRRKFGLILFDQKDLAQVTYTWPDDMKGPLRLDPNHPLVKWLRETGVELKLPRIDAAPTNALQGETQRKPNT